MSSNVFSSNHVFTLVDPLGRPHRIMRWGSYGVVCPTMVTTNGAPGILARVVIQELERGSNIVDSTLSSEAFVSAETLTKALREVCADE